MKQILLFTTIIISSFFSSTAQNCEVKLAAIRGTYTGDCENDKANGNGKSKGVDEFEGTFKNGYPEGKGIYVWHDGHYFIGLFKKGIKEGKGDMYYEAANGTDSIISGYWKKDKYIGEYENAWQLHSSSNKVAKVQVTKLSSSISEIEVRLSQITSGGNIRDSFVPFIISAAKLYGNFERISRQTLTNQSLTKFQDVTFPFRVVLTFSGDETADIIFNDPGQYSVDVILSL